ncbi:uncharacterized protein LOC117204842 isoform X2 [Bombus bifarius]|uniref:Uncharacterized protein LOC117204842 isoform X2 n=1 Tax=Bombus bifarius TaxID=103933 RepID=A0A6P8M7D2_9HYME|nr:uncharacterized protein LOC117204842 isoform X2 [Bombus bifarius]
MRIAPLMNTSWILTSECAVREHVSHKCRKRRFCSGGLERSLWARFWWPLSGNDDLGNSRWTEDFGARLSGTTDEETWKSSSPAERILISSAAKRCPSSPVRSSRSVFCGT